MPRVKLNLKNLSVNEKVLRARQIVTALTGNANFPNPQPALAQVTAAINGLEGAALEAQEARQIAKTRTAAQNAKEQVLDQAMTQLASYVESVAGQNDELILSVGFDVRGPSAPAAAEQPSLTATAGDHDGEIDLAWDTVRGARSYVVQRSPDPPTESSWAHVGVPTRSRFTVEGLTSGTRYWFRVAAINASEQGPWSNPAVKVAP
jgi:hypothetical protein